MCFKHSFRFIIIRESWCLVWWCCSKFLSRVKITQPHWGQTLMFAAWYICMSTKCKWEEFIFVTWSISACFDVISERCPPVHGGNWVPGISKVWMEDMGIHQKKRPLILMGALIYCWVGKRGRWWEDRSEVNVISRYKIWRCGMVGINKWVVRRVS